MSSFRAGCSSGSDMISCSISFLRSVSEYSSSESSPCPSQIAGVLNVVVLQLPYPSLHTLKYYSLPSQFIFASFHACLPTWVASTTVLTSRSFYPSTSLPECRTIQVVTTTVFHQQCTVDQLRSPAAWMPVQWQKKQ
eukprot:gnl/TRDRNA2_/TRDRNA2_155694_c0_seq3.p1 gnl/TRDRNA2_/TRDRNA2_155694_c0~~gnl/TRDRNA2_/TRDRNA2_155694_c0_seq3.p1  ORF type:complete len:137 (+),score=3.04 gnl/TRDRNA2_/TRDRNA2_155694_c0_seq3:168-578(+)